MKELYPWRKPVKISLPTSVKPQLIRHFSIGLLYPVTDELKEAREKAGLDPIPPTAHRYKEGAEDIRKIIKAMGVDRNIGLDLEKMEYRFK
ncbi:hdrC-like protein [Methanocella sp. CWC-04]|uniref:HdrC-like protein n=1 Tax=Methanooceanicella nereidis TaxID=2052831 RepID=A0AAP2RGV7_9EURY|nr:hdrC-like protein [Methanocella sp. CWC-04]MCD1295945.1 hdrC-like protein [Methanocella sp. CWC-04]